MQHVPQYTKISEVNLSAFIYTLFHEDPPQSSELIQELINILVHNVFRSALLAIFLHDAVSAAGMYTITGYKFVLCSLCSLITSGLSKDI